MARARTFPWIRIRPYRVLLRGQGVFFAVRSLADCITNMSGFDLRQAQPSCHGFKETVADGGLVSLGPDLRALARQGASLVDKIIKGARPADLPVEQPTRYVTSINVKTAKALGLNISQALLATADEVIAG